MSEAKQDIIYRLQRLMSGSCTCLTKTPVASEHSYSCPYRAMSEAVDALSQAGQDLPNGLTQAETDQSASVLGLVGQGGQGEAAPTNSFPSHAECAMRVHNSEFLAKRVAEGGYGPDHDSKTATQLHRFIYEYDDADPYRSAWFLHRLELLLNEVRGAAQPATVPAPMSEAQALEIAGRVSTCVEAIREAEVFHRVPAPVPQPSRHPYLTPEERRDIAELEDLAGGVFAAGALVAPVASAAMSEAWIRCAINGAVLWDCSPEEAYTAGIRYAEKHHRIEQQTAMEVTDSAIDAATRHIYHDGRPVSKEYRVGIVRAAFALRQQTAPAVPAGMQLVPVEADAALLRPFYNCPPDELPLAWSAAMRVAQVKLSAAPKPEHGEGK